AQMRKKNRAAYSPDEGTFACHVCACKKNKVAVFVHLNIVRYGLRQQQMIQAGCFQIRLIAIQYLRKFQIKIPGCYSHGIPGIESSVYFYQLMGFCPELISYIPSVMKVFTNGKLIIPGFGS